jgi:galactokinase
MELVRLALAEGVGALAASAFGAGFGGSVWALVETDGAEKAIDRWRQAYADVFPDASAAATFFISRPADAACFIA